MLKFPNLPKDAWIRTCQECFYHQVCKRTDSYKDDSWRNLRCKKCKSQALDYGMTNYEELEDN